jgi:hypothetical protein
MTQEMRRALWKQTSETQSMVRTTSMACLSVLEHGMLVLVPVVP